MEDEFDPHDARYYHLGCCGIHVTKAARFIAIASLVPICVTLICAANNYLTLSTSLLTSAEVLCVGFLLIAVFGEIGSLVYPFLVVQVLIAIKIILTSALQFTGEQDIALPFNYRELSMSVLAGRIVRLILTVYCIKIVINFFFFLKRRAAFERSLLVQDGDIPLGIDSNTNFSDKINIHYNPPNVSIDPRHEDQARPQFLCQQHPYQVEHRPDGKEDGAAGAMVASSMPIFLF